MIWLKGSTIGTAMLLLLGFAAINLLAQETPPPVTQDTVQMVPETTSVDTLKMEPAPIVPPVPAETTPVIPPPPPDTAKKMADTAQVKLDTIPTEKKSRMLEPAELQVPEEPPFFMKEIIFTTSRSAKGSFRVPDFIYTLNPSTNARQNHNILMDLLKNAAGVEVLESGQFLSHPAIRGVFGSRILLLQDGIRMNSFRDFPLWGTSPALIDVDQIEKIEILNGPASHLYGSDAYGGVINFITPRPEFLPEDEAENGYEWSGSYKFSYSSIGEQKKNRLALNLADRKWALTLGGSFRKVPHNYKSGGDNAKAVPNTGINEEASLDLNLGYKFRENQTFYFWGSRNRDFGIGGASLDNMSFPFQKRDRAALTYEVKGLVERIPWLNLKGFFQEQRRLLQLSLPPDTLNNIDSDVKLWGLTVEGLYLVPPHQTFSVGADFGRERIKGGNILFLEQANLVLDDTTQVLPEIHWDMAGVYVLDEITIDPQLSVFLGGRYDYNQIKHFDSTHFGTPPDERFDRYKSFQAGLVYRFQKGYQLNLNVARSFRTPTVVERYYFGPLNTENWLSPNERLKKERAVNFSLGAKANLDEFSASASWFYKDLKNFIDLQPASGALYQGKQIWTWKNLAGSTRMVGIEGAAEVSFTEEFYGFSNWSWIWGQHRRDTTAQRVDTAGAFEVVFVPPFKAYFGIGWKEEEGRLWAEISSRVVAQQERIPLNSSGQKILSNTSGFAIYSIRGGINLSGRQVLTLALNNIGNQFYIEPYNQFNSAVYNTAPVPEPGRNFSISLMVSY